MTNQFILTPYYLDRFEPGLETLARPHWRINKPDLPPGTTQERMAALYRPLADFVAGSVRQGSTAVSLAGDCVSSLGVLAGLQRAGVDPTLIWFDAHGDLNTWQTTPSGFLGGMPLAMLVGWGEQTIVEGVGLQPLPETQVIISDARDLDPGEKEALAASGVTHLPAVETLLDYPLPASPLYVHFDTDITNPDEAPAVSYRAAGGPSAAALRRVFRHLARTGRLVAISFSAWNVSLDPDGRTRDLSLSLLDDLLAAPGS